MANVLVLTLVFPPDSVSTAQLLGELSADLQRLGHSVRVVTTAPHYNRDETSEKRQPLRPYWGRVVQQSDFHGIPVLHTWMPRKGRSVAGRLLAWIGFHILSTIVALTVRPVPDVLLVPSPPLTIGVSAWIVALLRRSQFIYIVQEIYPDIAVKLGALRNRTVIRVLEAVERFVYRRASAVTVIAPGMRARLLEKGVPAAKAFMVPNFVDVDDLHPGPKVNPFSIEHGVAHKFVVMYAGNLGPAQGLDTFVDAAALLRDAPEIHCMLIGGGTSEAALRDRVARLRLTNCTLVPHQPYSRVPDIYAASDLCLIAQAAEIGSDAIPSKVYRIMACGRPAIACADPGGDLAQLIKDAHAGIVVPPGRPEALAAAIRDAARDPLRWRAVGEHARCFVAERYSRSAIVGEYHALIEQFAGPSVAARTAATTP